MVLAQPRVAALGRFDFAANCVVNKSSATCSRDFFRVVAASERPLLRPRAGLTQVGLPYASDAAITKHLAAFLTRHCLRRAARQRDRRASAHGDPVQRRRVQGRALARARDRHAERLARATRFGQGARAAGRRPGIWPSPGGAAYYGLVRHGRGLRIRGGTARAYYVGIRESDAPPCLGSSRRCSRCASRPSAWEEGTHAALPPQELFVVVGEPVTFRFFGSSTRRSDPAGSVLERWRPGELEDCRKSS